MLGWGSLLFNMRRYEELIDKATVDCYDEEEQHSGLLTMIGEEVVFPFSAKVMGDIIQVTGLKWPDHGYGLQLICEKKGPPIPFEGIAIFCKRIEAAAPGSR